MAKVSFRIPDSLQRKFEDLQGRSTEIIDQCVLAGAEVAEQAVKSSLQSVLSVEHQNGELVNALGVSPVLVDRNGVHNAKIGFAEPRKKQTSAKGKRSYSIQTNAMIATVLEYGSTRQRARPFLAPAKRSSRKSVIEAIEKKFDEEASNA